MATRQEWRDLRAALAELPPRAYPRAAVLIVLVLLRHAPTRSINGRLGLMSGVYAGVWYSMVQQYGWRVAHVVIASGRWSNLP